MDTDQTALVVLVPEADPFVAAFRDRYDSSAADGMTAHITILALFLPAGQIRSGVVDILKEVFRRHRRFSFTLSQLETFPGVLYLAPDPAQPFIALTESVVARFPECPPYGGAYPGDTPHLTIASTGDPETVNEIAQEFRRVHPHAVSIRSAARAVSLVVKRDGRWREEIRFDLSE